MEAQFLDGGNDLLDATETALTDNSRSNDRIATVACVVFRLLQHLNNVKNQTLVADSTKGAADDAGTAGNALVVVDNGFVLIVNADSFHFAALDAGTFLCNDGAIGARRGALATFDALRFVDMAAVIDNGDGSFGAHLLARVHKASTAHIGDNHAAGRAFVACLVEHLHHIGVGFVATHGHLHSVHQHRALLVDAAARLGLRTWGDGARDGVCVLQPTIVCPTDNLHQDLVFNPLYVCVK